MFAKPDVRRTDLPGGVVELHTAQELADFPRSMPHLLREWCDAGPDHPLVAERDSVGDWVRLSYRDVTTAADGIGQALLDWGLGPGRPLMVLSGNSAGHFVITMAAMTAGVPVIPVSVAYSLQSRDHARLRAIAALTRPGAVYAEDATVFAPALAALAGLPVIDRSMVNALSATPPGERLAGAYAGIGPDTVAKILFTSGSTGTPKGVLVTQRMMCANQRMIQQVWPFLADERPVLVDWLPWSHTFGGNHNVNLVLANGGSLYVDDGRPLPGLFERSIANLAEIHPTLYFNVPAGYAQLVPVLEADAGFARAFFSRLRLMFNAAAALPPALRDRLREVCRATVGRDIPVTSSWGATETGPAVTSAPYEFTDARTIGVPLPGTSVKLVPADDGFEARARGPQVTPGYFGSPELTAEAFDEDGYYRTGDTVDFADPADPGAGLVFRGRLAEDFKLGTGTFVRVGALRTALLSAAPVLSDAVIAGEERAHVAALAWLNPGEAAARLGLRAAEPRDFLDDPVLRDHLAAVLATLNAGAGPSGRVERLLVLARPPELDAGEITDKGYLNQRAVLRNRARMVDRLYADPPAPGVIVAGG